MIGTVPTFSGKMERRKEDRGKKVNKAEQVDVCKLEREYGCVQVRERVCVCVLCACVLFVTDVSHLPTC